jgi:hypothetical protein
MNLFATWVAVATTEKAGPGVVAALSAALVLFGLAVVLDLGRIRTWLVELRLRQNRDYPRLAKAFSEPTEDAERSSQHRWGIAGGLGFIAMGVATIWIWKG